MTTTAPPPDETVEPDASSAPDSPSSESGRARTASLSRTVDGDVVPSAWERARGRLRLEDPFVGWSSAIAVTLLSLFLRLWDLGSPKEFEFDETYYAKDAWSLLHFGYARDAADKANEAILSGTTTGSAVWKDTPEMIVHPEVGKWLIALGEKTFGMTPFGWRISAAVIGSLMILVMIRLARRVTGSTALSLVAGLLLSFDGLQFVLSRLALLDIFVAFFTLCAVTAIVCDRDWYRAKLARLVPEPITDPGAWGPVRRLLFRPWLLVSGVCWGLAIGTKWTAIYPLMVFGLLTWLWSGGARRTFGVRWATLRSMAADGVPAFLHLVAVAFVVYVVTWTGWLINAHQYEEHLSSTQYTQFVSEGGCGGPKGEDAQNVEDATKRWPTATEPDAHGLGEVIQSLRSLAYYHHDVYEFHTHFLNCSTHIYASKPSGWPLLNRPVGVAADTGIQPGTRGCQAPAGSDCLRQVLLIGTPVLWWGGILALAFAGLMWVGTRDWRFGLCVAGFLSSWIPWLMYDDRPIFSFYMIVAVPFMVLAVTLALGKLIGSSRASSERRTAGVVVAGSFFVLVLVNFAWFWPIFTNELLTKSEWLDRIWFSRWI